MRQGAQEEQHVERKPEVSLGNLLSTCRSKGKDSKCGRSLN